MTKQLLRTAGCQFPGLLSTALSGRLEVSSRVSIFPHGGRRSTWVAHGVLKLPDGEPTVYRCFSLAYVFMFTKGPAAQSEARKFQSATGRLLNLGALKEPVETRPRSLPFFDFSRRELLGASS